MAVQTRQCRYIQTSTEGESSGSASRHLELSRLSAKKTPQKTEGFNKYGSADAAMTVLYPDIHRR
jgi:hypothetical protein